MTHKALLRNPARAGMTVRNVVLGAVMLAGLAAASASAFPDARIDAQIRPRFGDLLQPPIRRHHPPRPIRRDDRWGYEREGRYYPMGRDYDRYHGPWTDEEWRRAHGYPIRGPIQTITVDCGDASEGPTPLSDALHVLADGGTIYIKAGGRACAETLFITRPVTIAGEPPSAFTAGPAPTAPVLAPEAGAPCIQIMPGSGAVELRDLTITADQAAGQACIQSWDSDLALVRTQLHYTGDASAVFVSGGHLLARDSVIGSGGHDPTLAVEGAGLMLDGVAVNAAATAVDIAASAEPMSLQNVTLAGVTGVDPTLASETGLTMRYSRAGSAALQVSQTEITGFRTGVWLDQGVRAQINQSEINHAKLGVVSRAVDLTLTESELNITDTGVYVVMGHAKISHNNLYGFENLPFAVDRGAEAALDDNWIYPRHDCRGFREFRHNCRSYGDRPSRYHDDDPDATAIDHPGSHGRGDEP